MNKTTGILRKTSYQQNVESHPELLVFAYQSKIIRDDEKALEFDRHSHLIPAPFEPDNLISRYDVRATLDAIPTETHDSYMNRMDFLSPSEQQAEAMAEKERYYSLYTNEVEEELYKEEQMKREQTEMYSQVAFSYDAIGPQESSAIVATQEPEESDTTPFTPSVRLDLPVDMEFPTTLKLNQIIEKTAKFISSQGLQMEILLKTKQASNPQFNFLNLDGQYNCYYKHILSMMKNGTYPWEDTARDKNDENSQDSEDLTISGTSSPAPVTSIIIPKMSFKPSADCAYTQLISKITKAPISEIEKQQENQNNGATSVEVVKKPNGLTGLVHYSSDSESEQEDEASLQVNVIYSGILPPSELQLVIDKTAVYVAKNGTDFEERLCLRKKNDERFQFLEATSEFHQYYVFKVNESRGGAPPAPTIGSLIQPKIEVKMPKAPPAPICFSIKPKEEKAQLKPTILQASSDDEGKPTPPDPPRITTVEEELELQVDAMNAEREEKLAKEKLSDKLLFAAKEKLGMLRKDKMLQIERKKKALMFINQIKDSNGNGNSTEGAGKEDEIINLTHYESDSDESVKSIRVSPVANVSRRQRSRKRSASPHHRHSYSSSSSSSRSPKRRHKNSKKSKSKKTKSKHRKRDRRSSSRSRSRSRDSRKRDRRERRY